jgi:hypothetical protein
MFRKIGISKRNCVSVKMRILKNENLCDFLSHDATSTVESRDVDRIGRKQDLEATEN